VPTDAEWLVLFNTYGGQADAGKIMKLQGAGQFGAVPSGAVYQNSAWSLNTPEVRASLFWSSETVGGMSIKSHGINSVDNSVSDYKSGRENGFSVRCISDVPAK
jgi:uncharacterized protein (TIGR02145 family)